MPTLATFTTISYYSQMAPGRIVAIPLQGQEKDAEPRAGRGGQAALRRWRAEGEDRQGDRDQPGDAVSVPEDGMTVLDAAGDGSVRMGRWGGSARA